MAGCSNITSGLIGTALCGTNIGGVTQILITNRADIGSIGLTNNGSGADSFVTSILATGSIATAVFYEYNVRKESAVFNETLTKETNGISFYTNELTIVLDKMEKVKRDELMLLDQADVSVIYRDANGIYWLFGYEEAASVSANSGTSGTARTDANGYTVVVTENGPQRAYQVDPTLIPTLYTPNTP